MEIRKEDMGRMFFKDSENTDKDIVKKIIKEYLCSKPMDRFYLLYGKTVGYYTFIKFEQKDFDKMVDGFMDLIANSPFINALGEDCHLQNIKELEINNNTGYLEIWSDGEFFALMPWGMEVI